MVWTPLGYNTSMSEKEEVAATIVFFGGPHRLPKLGDRVMLHISDGSWRSGFRCLSDPLESDGERVVQVTHEEDTDLLGASQRIVFGGRRREPPSTFSDTNGSLRFSAKLSDEKPEVSIELA
jgi:hypothetical protein